MEERSPEDMTDPDARRFGRVDERIEQGVINRNGRPAHTRAG